MQNSGFVHFRLISKVILAIFILIISFPAFSGDDKTIPVDSGLSWFMEIPGIEGDVLLDTNIGWIHVLATSLDIIASNVYDNPDGYVGNLKISKKIDKSSVFLYLRLLEGLDESPTTPPDIIKLEGRDLKNQNRLILKILFYEPKFESLISDGSYETITISYFNKIEWHYYHYDEKGVVTETAKFYFNPQQ